MKSLVLTAALVAALVTPAIVRAEYGPPAYAGEAPAAELRPVDQPSAPVYAAGPEGPMGPVGPSGSTGRTGSRGSRGHRGFRGTNGRPGVPGPVGPQGPQGVRGLAGRPGEETALPANVNAGIGNPEGLAEYRYAGPAGTSLWARFRDPAMWPALTWIVIILAICGAVATIMCVVIPAIQSRRKVAIATKDAHIFTEAGCTVKIATEDFYLSATPAAQAAETRTERKSGIKAWLTADEAVRVIGALRDTEKTSSPAPPEEPEPEPAPPAPPEEP